jgi:hypothetical protein
MSCHMNICTKGFNNSLKACSVFPFSSCHLPPKIWYLIPRRRYQRTGASRSKAAKADMSTAQLNATKSWCRVPLFWFALYNAIAREALAERLGLLLQSASAFGGKADMPFLHCKCPLVTQSGH